MITGSEAAVESEETAVGKLQQEASSIQNQITTGADNSLAFVNRELLRERGILEENQLRAAETLASYLHTMGMSEQETLDKAAKMVRETAAAVHADEDTAAAGLKNVTDHFGQAEDHVAQVVSGVREDDGFGLDVAAIDVSRIEAEAKNSGILLATEGQLASMEQNADAAGANLLDAVDAKAG